MKYDCLLCPTCKSDFKIISGDSALCVNNHSFRMDEGVLLLFPEYNADPQLDWDKSLRNPKTNLALDKKSMASKSKVRLECMLGYITSRVENKNITVLDIVTGRGLLLRKVLPKLTESDVYLNDRSADVLVGTCELVAPLLHTNTVIPLQSDASSLPFINDAFDLIISFGPNNAKPTSNVMKEAFRVLKKDGRFIFSLSQMENNSPSYYYMENTEQAVDNFDIIDSWQNEVKETGFTIENQEILFDGKVNKIPLDIIPIENGERLQDIGITLTR